MTKIAASQRQEVGALCMAGATQREVADQYGVTRSCIAAILRGLGVSLHEASRGPASVGGKAHARYLAMAEMYLSGKSQMETAEAFAVTVGCVSNALKRLGTPIRRGLGKTGNYKRAVPAGEHQAMAEKYKSGATLEEIGAEYGVSRERVRQILTRRFGITKTQGGGLVRSFRDTSIKVAALRARNERREAYWRGIWGVSLDDYQALVAEHGSSEVSTSPLRKYIQQRNNAKRRGIAWNFTFPEWWGVWQDSGKWEQRALSKEGYVMARYGDGDTPYSVENVYICTASQNAKDSYIVSPSVERVAKARITRARKSQETQPCLL